MSGFGATHELVEAVTSLAVLSGETERPAAHIIQKYRNSDEPVVKFKFKRLLGESYQVEKPRLLAAAESLLGFWLQSISVPSLGTQREANTLTEAVDSRLCVQVGAEPTVILYAP